MEIVRKEHQASKAKELTECQRHVQQHDRYATSELACPKVGEGT
jgi:hypothetical protein